MAIRNRNFSATTKGTMALSMAPATKSKLQIPQALQALVIFSQHLWHYPAQSVCYIIHSSLYLLFSLKPW